MFQVGFNKLNPLISETALIEGIMDIGQEPILYTSYVLITSVTVILITLGWKYKKTWDKRKQESYIDGYVDCMVDTYFYGYLKKIIPDDGTAGGGLPEKIMLYKEKNGLTNDDFPFHKIFILICASGFVPPLLESIDKDRIEARKNLEPVVLNRAGTSGRVYSTAVYKIKHRDLKNHITVAMEGAPPLLTLSDSCKEDPELKKAKRKIITMFYEKLSQKLNDNEEFANSYEILFYEDMPGQPPTLADKIIHIHIDRGLPTNPIV